MKKMFSNMFSSPEQPEVEMETRTGRLLRIGILFCTDIHVTWGILLEGDTRIYRYTVLTSYVGLSAPGDEVCFKTLKGKTTIVDDTFQNMTFRLTAPK